MGLFKDIVNWLVVEPTKSVTKATIQGAQSVGSLVKSGYQAVSGDKSAAKESLNNSVGFFKSSVGNSVQIDTINEVKQDPQKAKVIGGVVTAVGGVLTATGVAAPVGAALMTAGGYIMKGSDVVNSVNQAEMAYKNGDIETAARSLGGGFSALFKGTKYEDKYNELSIQVNNAYQVVSDLSEAYNRNLLVVDGGGNNLVIPSGIIGGNTINPQFSAFDRVLIWLFNLGNK